jgi:hypothetical protein
MKRLMALAVLMLGYVVSAQAAYVPATWTDTKSFGTGETVGLFKSFTYTHDITDNGFKPFPLGYVDSFQLSINLKDDSRDAWYEGAEEALVYLPSSFGLASGEVTSFGWSSVNFGWSILGSIELSLLGTLTVTISSLVGDFLVMGSQLVAHGGVDSATVPEPGALGLLGIGLLGMAATMRRKAQLRK